MNALVTGASRGIGRAVVLQLVERGRRVVAVARDAVALHALAAEWPGKVVPLACDLGEEEAASLFDRAEAQVGGIDELVCAAGQVRYQAWSDATRADVEAQLQLNFVSSFLLAQRAASGMHARGKGAIVAVGSTLASCHAPLTAAYAASKAALHAAFRTLALELAPCVRVNVVAPGVIDTDMVRVQRPGTTDDTMEAQLVSLASLHPLARLGLPEEVAEAVCFALESEFMTGTVLTLDGGLTLR